jgi:hypothetical protein
MLCSDHSSCHLQTMQTIWKEGCAGSAKSCAGMRFPAGLLPLHIDISCSAYTGAGE